jgi:hypothetical protein
MTGPIELPRPPRASPPRSRPRGGQHGNRSSFQVLQDEIAAVQGWFL